MEWVRWATLVAWATWVAGSGTKENRIQALKRAACRMRCPQRMRREGVLSRVSLLNLGRGPESAECARPVHVDDAISSGFAHALPQCGIRHQRPNGPCEVFRVV